MTEMMMINKQVTVGAQPSEAELETLSNQGFQSVVNFRTPNEDEQILAPEVEGESAKSKGLEYLHLPVSSETMSPSLVDKFREQFDLLPKPVFAHCKSGKRAGAMVMMKMAVDKGMSGQATLDKAREMGFECDEPKLKEFVKQYVDKHLQ